MRSRAELSSSQKLLDNADHLITYASLGHLLDICVRETNCKHFGLLLGERSGGAYLGILHSIARNSPNVERRFELSFAISITMTKRPSRNSSSLTRA